MNQIVSRGFCSPIGLHGVSFVRASRVKPRRSFFHRLGSRRGCFLLGEQPRRRPLLPVPTRPRRSAVRRPVPTCSGYVRVLDSTSYNNFLGHALHEKGLFPDMPCMKKGFTETNSRRYTGQQPATKSARGPAVKPLVNRGSTAGQPDVLFLHRYT